jgi:pyridoxamine 5'-phosphate oxidase
MEDAEERSEQNYPNACYLATISENGYPECRTVLLRQYNSKGFTFYTNLNSGKGRALKGQPQAALTFHWDKLHRQIRILGKTEVVSDKQADEYFAGRPRLSQLGAWASRQSEPLASREELENRVAEYDKRFANQPIPRPSHWGGFTLVPKSYEFMQEGEGRLHNRFIYEPRQQGWTITRLNP